MSACAKCWQDATMRAMDRGGSITDHYHDLLEERKDKPCSDEEAKHETCDRFRPQPGNVFASRCRECGKPIGLHTEFHNAESRSR